MNDPITPDPAGLSGMRPSLRTTLAALYREYAEASFLLGQHDQAERCLVNASALEYGGRVDLEALACDS